MRCAAPTWTPDAPVRCGWSAPPSPDAPGTARSRRGECVRIMTGAVMPAGCDTVVPQEFTSDASDTLGHHPASGTSRPGDNRRFKGEDLEAGSPALAWRQDLAAGRPRPAGIAGHRRSAGAAPLARRLLFDRR